MTYLLVYEIYGGQKLEAWFYTEKAALESLSDLKRTRKDANILGLFQLIKIAQ